MSDHTIDGQSATSQSENEPETESTRMVPLFAARVSDLAPGDFVVVQCGACGHDGLVHPAALPSLGLRLDERITDLALRLRCRECDVKGRAVVSIRWAAC